jgi:hypothetical protein
MKRLVPILILFCLSISACTPSEAQIAAAIAQTQTAAYTPPATETVTPTVLPSDTPTASDTPTPALDYSTFEAYIVSTINSVEDVRVVHWVRLENGIVNIDFQTKWQAADNQSQAHYNIIKQLSGFCANTSADQVLLYTGVSAPSIHITTQSVDELYVFESTTTFKQCVSVGLNELNYKDWQAQAEITQTK